MIFKHYATDEIIEVEPVESEEGGVVYCKELDKHFNVVDRKSGGKVLERTSYVLVENSVITKE